MASRYNTTNILLSQYAIQRRNAESMLIGRKVAPMVTVDKDSAYYPVFGEEFLQISQFGGVRASAARAERVDFTYSTTQYTTKESAFEAFLDDRDLQNAQPELQVERQKVNIATDKQLMGYEAAVAAAAFNTANFTSYTAALSGTDRWDNANSDPRVQAIIAMDSIRLNGVVDPSKLTLIVGADVWTKLQFNQNLISTFKYTNPYALNTEMVAKALGIKDVIVGFGTKKNEQTGVKSAIWGKFALFAYLNESPTLEDVSTMKTFVLKDKDLRIETYRDEPVKSTVYRSIWDYSVVVPASSSGYLFSTVIS